MHICRHSEREINARERECTVVTRIRINDDNASIDRRRTDRIGFILPDRSFRLIESIFQWQLIFKINERLESRIADRFLFVARDAPRPHLVSSSRWHDSRSVFLGIRCASVATRRRACRGSPRCRRWSARARYTWLLRVCVRRAARQIELNSRKRDRRVARIAAINPP